jgi:hypothetical protein
MRPLALAGLAAAACAVPAPNLTASDAELCGREVAVSVEGVPGGFRVRGRLRVAVPPAVLEALTTRPSDLVRLFPTRVAGAARWPLPREERFFFAAHLFGRTFRSWGHARREVSADHVVVRWRTDGGAHGSASAERFGRGSDVSFDSFFPSRVDLARYLPRFGVELVLKLVAFAMRSRLEQLWREGALPSAPGLAGPSFAGIAPRAPWRAGSRGTSAR